MSTDEFVRQLAGDIKREAYYLAEKKSEMGWWPDEAESLMRHVREYITCEVALYQQSLRKAEIKK